MATLAFALSLWLTFFGLVTENLSLVIGGAVSFGAWLLLIYILQKTKE